MPELQITTLPGIPLVQPGDDLCAIIVNAAAQADFSFRAGDIVVVAQKIVSKAEGRLVALNDVKPSTAAHELAQATDKDARLVQLILDESTTVMRHKPGVIIVRHRPRS